MFSLQIQRHRLRFMPKQIVDEICFNSEMFGKCYKGVGVDINAEKSKYVSFFIIRMQDRIIM
jgi:hypothetical protein